ncbi:MAG TPA: UDP-N-acetylmuramate--L-alanine ligase [Tissierellaceae bacterium]|nr:UDP-N-acetylmuramate--L-alanine ligase [Tissierellaceae bacterium]
MFKFVLGDHKYKHVHFIGIGGISMSGLAEILLNKGYEVSGTDNKYNRITKRLKDLGANIYINHQKENIAGSDLIIYTDAISNDNIELKAAFESGVDTIDRATFLGALMKNYPYSIAVSGTHGKTTTTSMIATITNHGNLDPTVLLGGELDDIGGNVKLGSDEYILTEACEYKANILKYFPTTAIILNIDEDHLDYFRDMDHIIETFVKYGENLEENSNLIINSDDPYADNVIEKTKANVVTFGIKSECDFKAENIKFTHEGYPSYTLNIGDKEYHTIDLHVMGEHNIYNSLASIATAYIHGVSMEDIINHLALYTGVHRRLELKGFIKGVKVIDDYAHHPTEIQATLKAINNNIGKVYCIFQPHTFTRTKILLNSFSESFKKADQVIITDIYAARENNNGEVHSRDLVDAVNTKSGNAIYLETFEETETYLFNNVKNGDIVLTMGAGNVYLIGESMLGKSKQENEKAAV